MTSHVRVPLTGLQVAECLVSLVVAAVGFCVKLPFDLVRYSSWPLRRTAFVSFAQLAGNLRFIHILQNAYDPTTGEGIDRFCRRTKRTSQAHRIDCGPKTPACALHQIQIGVAQGAFKPKRALVYLHGGAYYTALKDRGHPALAIGLAESASCDDVYFLEYTLAPRLKYPGHLVQAAHSIKYLIQHEGLSPSQIYLAGDSAGGHLILSILAHCVKPHFAAPDLRQLVNLETPLAAAVLISPLASFNNDFPSNRTEKYRDLIPLGTMERMIAFLQPVVSEVQAEPFLEGASSFWKTQIPIKAVCMTVGEWEILRDQIIKLAKVMGATETGRERRLIMGPKEVHVQTGFDRALGLTARDTKSCFEAMKWLELLDGRV